MNNDTIKQLQRDTPEDIKAASQNSMKFERMKRGVLIVCETFAVPTREYNAGATESEIIKFIHSEGGILRILYSEINMQLMNMTLEERGVFSTNVEKFLSFVLGEEEHEMDVIKIALKIYDHTQLVISQMTSVDEILVPRLDDAKIAMKEEMKIVEREYITILGIFAAIMLAFVGSYTFSTSVLNNVGKVSLSSLVIIASLIGTVFYMIISLLLSFLYEINDKEHLSGSKVSLRIKYLIFFMIGLFIGILIYHNAGFIANKLLHFFSINATINLQIKE